MKDLFRSFVFVIGLWALSTTPIGGLAMIPLLPCLFIALYPFRSSVDAIPTIAMVLGLALNTLFYWGVLVVYRRRKARRQSEQGPNDPDDLDELGTRDDLDEPGTRDPGPGTD